ncbi:MAG: hypothetical protein V1776_03765 [Candidatus Diapherotrites archaeon]
MDVFFKNIVDKSGKVRFAAVNTFGNLRPMGRRFDGSMYVDLYIVLQDLHDNETDSRKKKSIELVLSKLWCPMLDTYTWTSTATNRLLNWGPIPIVYSGVISTIFESNINTYGILLL